MRVPKTCCTTQPTNKPALPTIAEQRRPNEDVVTGVIHLIRVQHMPTPAAADHAWASDAHPCRPDRRTDRDEAVPERTSPLAGRGCPAVGTGCGARGH